jgi:hypothetical protein
MDTTSMILKTDSRGRVRTPVGRREELLDEFERSGLSATKFAALVGVRYQTFATWVQQRKGERKKGAGRPRGSKAVCLVEAVVDASAGEAAGGALRLLLPGGATMEVRNKTQAALAAQLLQAFGGGRSC